MTTKEYKNYTVKTPLQKITKGIWFVALGCFIGNCFLIAITTFSIIERQSINQEIRVLSSEISAHELGYLQLEKELTLDSIKTIGLVEPDDIAYATKSSWFAFYEQN